jgi:hypothetical protein
MNEETGRLQFSDTSVRQARHRIEVLHQDTTSQDARDMRRVTYAEHIDLGIVLSELHRANKVMRDQQARIAEYAQTEFLRKKRAAK